MQKECSVTNKSAGTVIYNIPELKVRREFAPHETKHLNVAELDALAMMAGGKELIYNYLFVNDEEVIRHLINGEVVPEYYLTEEQIPSWMDTCSLDEFKDALDFAPAGTKDLIKKYAVEKPLNDFSKREAIKTQLGFDVTRVLENIQPDPEEKKPVANKVVGSTVNGRRTAATTIKKPAEDKE